MKRVFFGSLLSCMFVGQGFAAARVQNKLLPRPVPFEKRASETLRAKLDQGFLCVAPLAAAGVGIYMNNVKRDPLWGGAIAGGAGLLFGSASAVNWFCQNMAHKDYVKCMEEAHLTDIQLLKQECEVIQNQIAARSGVNKDDIRVDTKSLYRDINHSRNCASKASPLKLMCAKIAAGTSAFACLVGAYLAGPSLYKMLFNK